LLCHGHVALSRHTGAPPAPSSERFGSDCKAVAHEHGDEERK
jgi:hypothetical protein